MSPLDVRCPFCAAKPGESCEAFTRRDDGRTVLVPTSPHLARIRNRNRQEVGA